MDARVEALVLLRSIVEQSGVELFPGAEKEEIDNLSRDLGFEVSWDVSEWLRSCRVPILLGKKLLTTGLSAGATTIERILPCNPDWKEYRMIPLMMDEFGNIYAASSAHSTAKGTPVVFFDHDESFATPTYTVASGVWEFLRFLFDNELILLKISSKADPDDERWSEEYDAAIYWPFNKARVLAIDPALAECTAAPLPWDAL